MELWMFSLETLGGVNQLNYNTLGYVLFYFDYVIILHNIHVIHVLNYARNVSDFFVHTKRQKTFLAHFQGQYQTQKNEMVF